MMLENSIDVVVRINPSSVMDMLLEDGYTKEEINNFTEKDKSELLSETIKDYLKPHIADFSCNCVYTLLRKDDEINKKS